jgi:hypothetical protein
MLSGAISNNYVRVATQRQVLTLSGRRTKSARGRLIDATEVELIDLRS